MLDSAIWQETELGQREPLAPPDDELGRFLAVGHGSTIAGSALGYAMDGFDLLILGFMLKAITADLDLTQTQGASLVTGTQFAMTSGRWSATGAARSTFSGPSRATSSSISRL